MQFHDNVRGYFKDYIIYEPMRQHDPSVAPDIFFLKNMNCRLPWEFVQPKLKLNCGHPKRKKAILKIKGVVIRYTQLFLNASSKYGEIRLHFGNDNPWIGQLNKNLNSLLKLNLCVLYATTTFFLHSSDPPVMTL